VREPVERFLGLFEAVRDADLRAGWLELEPPPPLDAFDRVTAAGALRAVAVGEGRALSLKRLRGTPVLGDLLREHFLGCAAVLVRGEPTAAALRLRARRPPPSAGEPDWWRLAPAGDDVPWRLEPAAGEARSFELAALVARLRRPRLD
jgi:hypothetical protein